jgi:hypothetical protein
MTRRSKVLAVGAIGSVGLFAVLVLTAIQYGYGASDTVNCLVTTGQHATKYATGYTDRAFAQIHAGMTRDEVLRVLGEPLERATWSSWPEGDWKYSQPATSSGHFHLRSVRFAPDGMVSDAIRVFYFD